MESVKQKSVLEHIRSLELNHDVVLPRTKVGAVNSAIYHVTSAYTRKFSRILTDDKLHYRITRIA